MYTFEDRVRFSETDENGVCTILAMLNYLQDCSVFHSNDVGLSIKRLEDMKIAWLLCYWDIYIDRLPKLCEKIEVGTVPHKNNGILAWRDFWIKSLDTGEMLIKADSIWFIVDIEKRRPRKIDKEIFKPYGELIDILKLPESSRKLKMPNDMKAIKSFKIEHRHLDSNHHMNNANYIRIADAIYEENEGASEKIKRIRTEYVNEARLGDIVYPYYKKEDDGIYINFRNEKGEVYSNVIFR